ncbi:RNA N6-adenosine-methyltransferase mettl16-like [Mya arenaria]|uniref:RNA N6-adenosine-methyltransferase mettl16-like n=1 Tax=Mya arenaria TaxID=6604 RepID=UPI0022E6826C|nr:RNA N6-adenosine-methyltransferase mettl16-like [Mya arenaria]XP_052801811.1 RNA N6-adenosine-methyltransferase mettl16-like [Mya arenaria]
MSLNKYMHPRNKYKTKKPNFQDLAFKYDYFKEMVKETDSGKVTIDFKDPASSRALTRALLENDFGLKITLPLDRLIPAVPQRINYILWLEDIIGIEKAARGIDIGTGSSCIYPLLGCRQNGWEFLASEVDDQNVYFANKNIQQNDMTDKIKVVKVEEDTLLMGLLENNEDCYDFCMCNPPFFSDHLEAQGVTNTRSDNRSDASSVSTASEAESVAWGGEVRFVSQMIEDSLKLKSRIRVYTSLIGKKTSLPLLKHFLHERQVPKISTTEFCQGRTMRWGIAWTFDETVTFPKSLFKEQKNVKPPLVLEIPRGAGGVGDYTVQAFTWVIRKYIEVLQINYYTKHCGKFYTCLIMQAKTNTWSNQRRKRRERARKQSVSEEGEGNRTAGIPVEGNSTSGESGEVKTPADSVEKNMETDDKCTVTSTETDAKIVAHSDNDTEKGSNVSKDSGIEEFATEKGDNDESKKSGQKRSNDENNGTEPAQKRLKKDQGKDCETSEQEKEAVTSDKSCNNSSAITLSRKDVVERFWKEHSENQEGKKKKPLSFYEKLEPFSESEECLLLCKLVLKKEEGEMTLTLTHQAGNKEALHQIMQFFKNKLAVKPKT